MPAQRHLRAPLVMSMESIRSAETVDAGETLEGIADGG
jgi:hypothetical protein